MFNFIPKCLDCTWLKNHDQRDYRKKLSVTFRVFKTYSQLHWREGLFSDKSLSTIKNKFSSSLSLSLSLDHSLSNKTETHGISWIMGWEGGRIKLIGFLLCVNCHELWLTPSNKQKYSLFTDKKLRQGEVVGKGCKWNLLSVLQAWSAKHKVHHLRSHFHQDATDLAQEVLWIHIFWEKWCISHTILCFLQWRC